MESCQFLDNKFVKIPEKLNHQFSSAVLVSHGEPDDGEYASENSPPIAQRLYVSRCLFMNNDYSDTSSYIYPRNVGSLIWSKTSELYIEDNCFVNNFVQNSTVH